MKDDNVNETGKDADLLDEIEEIGGMATLNGGEDVEAISLADIDAMFGD